MPPLEAVRRLIAREVSALGLVSRPPQFETGWIGSGYQHCRRFDMGEVQAVWFLETGRVRFYRRDRTPLRTVSLEEPLGNDRNAA